MRVIEKFPNYGEMEPIYYFENVKRDKEIGLLGKQCRFIVKTIAEKMKNFEETYVQFYSASIICALLFLHERKFSNL